MIDPLIAILMPFDVQNVSQIIYEPHLSLKSVILFKYRQVNLNYGNKLSEFNSLFCKELTGIIKSSQYQLI